jgi:hypothetical protein
MPGLYIGVKEFIWSTGSLLKTVLAKGKAVYVKAGKSNGALYGCIYRLSIILQGFF